MTDTRIDFVRSGGLAGLSMGTSVDVSSLAPEAAAAVEEALNNVDLDALAGSASREPSGPDRFQYDLTVTTGGQSRRVSLQERDIPAELRPLIDALLPLARPQP